MFLPLFSVLYCCDSVEGGGHALSQSNVRLDVPEIPVIRGVAAGRRRVVEASRGFVIAVAVGDGATITADAAAAATVGWAGGMTVARVAGAQSITVRRSGTNY